MLRNVKTGSPISVGSTCRRRHFVDDSGMSLGIDEQLYRFIGKMLMTLTSCRFFFRMICYLAVNNTKRTGEDTAIAGEVVADRTETSGTTFC